MVELTEHQLYVLRRLAEGADPHEIAKERKCSKKTVEFHRQAVYDWLADFGVRQGRIADLTHYALAEGITALRLFDDNEDMRLTFNKAKQRLGLPPDFEVADQACMDAALKLWKDKTIVARRANEDNLAAELSEAKMVLCKRYERRKSRFCPDCGQAKSFHSQRCSLCARSARFPADEKVNPVSVKVIPMKEHEIEESLVIIGPRCHQTGVLTSIIRKLATTGNVGDSFVTDKQSTSIKNVARMAGMEVIVRIANPEEKDLKKRRYRVWRSDGKTLEEVNALIQKRRAGETVPPSPPCVAPPPDQLPNRHPKKKAAA